MCDLRASPPRTLCITAVPPLAYAARATFASAMTEDQEPPQDLATTLNPAVSEFRSAVERQAWELLSAAERRAEDRERDAAKVARRTEADAERKAERILQAALERASVVLAAIEALEDELPGTMDGLPTEASRLTTELTTQAKGPQGQLTASPVIDAEIVPMESGLASPAARAISGIEGQLAVVPTMQLRQVIRAIVSKMRDEGRGREEAEVFLVRFRLEAAHGDLLDEIFGARSMRSRGAWRGWPSRRRER